MVIENALRVSTRDAVASLKALDVQADITDAKLEGIGRRLDEIGGRQTISNLESVGSSFRRLDSGLLVSQRNWDSFGGKVQETGGKIDSVGQTIDSVAAKTTNLKNETESATASMSASWERTSGKMRQDLSNMGALITDLSAQRRAAGNEVERALLDQKLASAKNSLRLLARDAAWGQLQQDARNVGLAFDDATKRIIAAPEAAAAAGGGGGGGGGFFRRAGRFFWHDPGGGGGGGPGGGGGLVGRRGLLWRPGGMGPLQLGGLSLATMLGLGPEHIIGAGLAVGGSAMGAAAGAGLIGLGGLGTMAVGAGSDLAVMKATLTGAQQINKAYNTLSTAVQTYGANSRQAATAYKQFQQVMADQGPAAKAELSLVKAHQALSNFWKTATASAKIISAGIMQDALGVATAYVPKIADAAKQNLAIIRSGLQPLFAWLKGPQGMGVFNELEGVFKQNLPTAIHALDQGIELLLRTMGLMAPQVGGITRAFDRFFTRLNKESDQQLMVNHFDKLIADFTLWENLIKGVGHDLSLLFHAGAGEGNTLVSDLTNIVTKFGEWEASAKGQSFLHTFFQNRGQELEALFRLIGPVSSAFFSMYRALQPLVPAVTTLANGIASVLRFIVDLGQHSTVFRDAIVLPMAAFLVSWRLFGRESALGLFNLKARFLDVKGVLDGLKSGIAGVGGVLTTLFRQGPGAAWQGIKDLFRSGPAAATPAEAMSTAIVSGSEAGAALFRAAILEASGQGAVEMRAGQMPLFGPGVGAAAAGGETVAAGEVAAAGGLGLGAIARSAVPMLLAAGVAYLGISQLSKITDSSATAWQGTGQLGPQQLLMGNLGPMPRSGTGGAWGQALKTFGGDPYAAQLAMAGPGQLSALVGQFRSPNAGTMGSPGAIGAGAQSYLTKWLPTTQQVDILNASNQQLAALRQRAQALIQLPGITDKQRASLQSFIDELNPVQVQLRKTQALWTSTFQGINATTGSVMQQVSQVIKTDLQNISQNLGTDTVQGASAFTAVLTGAYQTIAGNTNLASKAVQAGLVQINTMLNNALKQLGAPSLTKSLMQALGPVSTMDWLKFQATGGTGRTSLGGARGTGVGGAYESGGYIGRPGERGPDDVNIWAGRGEAILNDAHQSVVNKALRRAYNIAGLPDLFGRMVGRKHGYAGGGIVTASEFGGPGDPATGSRGYRGDNLYQHPDSYAELGNGAALGGLPYMTPLSVGYQGRVARLYKRDIGAGGPGIGGHPRAIDLWFQAAQTLGFSGLGLVSINGAGGANVSIIGGGAGVVPVLKSPQVGGTGMLRDTAQLSIDQITRTANQYLQAHAPVASVGGGLPPVRHGKYFFPLPPGSWRAGSVDQGWDLSAGAHTPEYAIGAGTIIGHGISGFGPWAPILRLDQGGAAYYGHAGPGGQLPVGTHVSAGQVIGEVGAGIVGISTGPHLEIGWYPPGSMGSGASMKHALGYARGGFAGWYRDGGSFVAHSPTLVGVGDRPGGERIDITPAGGTPRGPMVHIGQLVVENHRKGDVKEMILQELEEVERELASSHVHDPAEMIR